MAAAMGTTSRIEGLPATAGDAQATRRDNTDEMQSQTNQRILERIEELKKIPNQILEGNLQLGWMDLCQILHELIRRENDHPNPHHKPTTSDTDLKELRGELQELKETIKKGFEKQEAATNTQETQKSTETTKAKTYADAAATPQITATGTQTHRKLNAAPPMRKARELIIKFASKADTDANQRRERNQILETIKRTDPQAHRDIVSLRRLPSGDLALHMINEEARQKWERTDKWIRGLGESASIARKAYAVLVHGVPVQLNTSNQGAAAKRIQEENATLHPDLEILRIAWPKSVKNTGKTRSSLIIETASAAQANRILDEGILVGHSECDTELFEKECRITQCHKCYGFGHIAKVCNNQTICHICGYNHTSDKCRRKAGSYCANCKKEGHKPWQGTCEVFQARKATADYAFKNRPPRYQENHPPKPTIISIQSGASTIPEGTPTQTPQARSGHTADPPQVEPQQPEQESEENSTDLPQNLWTLATGRNSRKRPSDEEPIRGRPKMIRQAAKAPGQRRITQTLIYSPASSQREAALSQGTSSDLLTFSS